MRDKFELSQDLQDLMTRQQELLGCYRELIERIADPKLQQDLTLLLRTKSGHLELTERLMEIVES
jgi:hypothetical protein